MSTPKFLSLEAIQKQTNTCLDDLPDELLVEILARVPSATSMYPATETAHLRTVSRSWNSIISSAAFIPHFISFGKENNCSWGNGETLLFQDLSESTVPFYLVPSQCDLTVIDQPALDFSYISDEYFIIAASDDLLLLRECPSSPLVVCNPFTKSLMNPDRKDDAMGMGSEKVKAGGEFRRICSHEEAGTSRGGSFEQTVNQRLMTSTSILSQHEDAIQPLPYIPVSTCNKIFKSKVVKAALMVGVYLQILQLMSGFKVVLHYTPHKMLGKACRLSVVLYRRSDLVSLLISVLTILLTLLCIRGR